jgi:hypothetical protein
VALLAAIGILAGASIAYEILLTRLFSILLWHHFAYMIISVALLGIGASGTFLAFARRILAPRFTLVFASCAVLFATSAVGGFALAQRVPFNPLEIIWDAGQQINLAQIYGLIALPFFAVGAAIGFAFIVYKNRIAAITELISSAPLWAPFSSLPYCISSRRRTASALSADLALSPLPLQSGPGSICGRHSPSPLSRGSLQQPGPARGWSCDHPLTRA